MTDHVTENRTTKVGDNLLMGGKYSIQAQVPSGICVRVCSVGVEGKGDKSKPANFVVSRFLPHSTRQLSPTTCNTHLLKDQHCFSNYTCEGRGEIEEDDNTQFCPSYFAHIVSQVLKCSGPLSLSGFLENDLV